MRARIVGKSSAARGRGRSRHSSSMRARIVEKSSATRGLVTFPPFLVVLISISRPRQSARSGWGHWLTRYRRARSLPSRSCYRGDRARVKLEPQTQRRSLVEAATPEILDRHSDLRTVMEVGAAPFKYLQPDHGPRCTRCCSPLHSRPLSLIDSPEHLLNQAGAATFKSGAGGAAPSPAREYIRWLLAPGAGRKAILTKHVLV